MAWLRRVSRVTSKFSTGRVVRANVAFCLDLHRVAKGVVEETTTSFLKSEETVSKSERLCRGIVVKIGATERCFGSLLMNVSDVEGV